MKISRRQIRQIIKEAISGSDPKSLYERMLELKKSHGTHFNYIERLGKDVYDDLINLLTTMHAEDSSYDGYGKFLDTVRVAPYRLQPAGAYRMWFGSQIPGATPSPQDALDAMDLFEEYQSLKDQFETVDGTDQTDRVYGRKRSNVIHKPTGTRVKSSTDRKGSLGT